MDCSDDRPAHPSSFDASAEFGSSTRPLGHTTPEFDQHDIHDLAKGGILKLHDRSTKSDGLLDRSLQTRSHAVMQISID
ncbi:hypothetical protein [Methylobacterium sp. SI9]|uniref:hypothetical protein n=1 Tax=Methylobacterium guangdongense TaxID=3138811 RepID=UPI00313B22EA